MEEIGDGPDCSDRSPIGWTYVPSVSHSDFLIQPLGTAVLNDYELIGGRHNAAQFMSSRPVKSLLSKGGKSPAG